MTLIDGGWAVREARDQLESAIADIGLGFRDIEEILVTHAHRDHYTLASELRAEWGMRVRLGEGEKPVLDLVNEPGLVTERVFIKALASCGAPDLADRWLDINHLSKNPLSWQYPDAWFSGDVEIAVGHRTLQAVHTPGHTPGHYVFASIGDGLLFAGDHVLPTITPSIGFATPIPTDPLGDFMASLTKVRSLPNMQLLPAHGPVAPSSHERVDELLSHHEHRLALLLAALGDGPASPHAVAGLIPWTRHDRALEELDEFNRAMAVLETRAHLELLVARGVTERHADSDDVVIYRRMDEADGSVARKKG